MGDDAIVFCRMAEQCAPAAAGFKQPLAGCQAQLAADEIKLGNRSLFQRGIGSGEIGGGIDHLFIEEEPVEFIGEIIVEMDESLAMVT